MHCSEGVADEKRGSVSRPRRDSMRQGCDRAGAITRSAILALFVCAGMVSFVRAEEVQVDAVMYQDPDIALPEPIHSLAPGVKPLWLKALAQPEADLKRQAAETIAIAHRRGLPGLQDTVEPLLRTLKAADGRPVVRLAAARALVVLEARAAAPVLFQLVDVDGLDANQFVEPALAAWDYRPIRDVWLRRVSEPHTSDRRLVLATRGLATVGETKAVPALLQLVRTPAVSAAVRVEAARALAVLESKGLEDVASDLSQDGSPRGLVDRLVSASLLASHQGKNAEALLLKLAVDSEPAVAAIALKRLLELDPNLIVAMAERILSSRDANVRHLGAQTLVARPTPNAIQQLGPILDDPHPDVRRYVQASFHELAARKEFDQPVREAAMKVLATDRWRGLEQAALLLGALDHKPAADRLVELLRFQRSEVCVTVAWALRKLALRSTLNAMLDHAQQTTDDRFRPDLPEEAVANQISQIFQAFGQMKFADAESLLRLYIPKGSHHQESRAAAIWALGHIHADHPRPDLTKLFSERLSDLSPMDPECEKVRSMSAVSLGRMKAKDALPTLRKFFQGERVSLVGEACGWAVNQLTGEIIPELTPPIRYETGWFLEPLD